MELVVDKNDAEKSEVQQWSLSEMDHAREQMAIPRANFSSLPSFLHSPVTGRKSPISTPETRG